MQGKVTNEGHVLNLSNFNNVSENKETFIAVRQIENSLMFTYIIA